MSSIHLKKMEDKLSVVDVLYRFAAGIDLRDRVLLAATFTEDAISDFRQGRETIVSVLSDSLQPFDTTHTVTNPRVCIDGDKAYLEAIVEAQHLPRDDHSRHYLMKNRYDVELVRHGEAWLIQRATIDNVWRDGNPAVLSGV